MRLKQLKAVARRMDFSTGEFMWFILRQTKALSMRLPPHLRVPVPFRSTLASPPDNNVPMKTRIVTLCCVLAILFAQMPQASAMDDGSPEAVAADVLVVRPACFVMTIIGSAIFVVALPVAAISKSTRQTADALVVRPARATFTRPVGDMTALEEL